MGRLFVWAALCVVASSLELTDETYKTATDGKVVFIKHYAPWCGHCKKMAPDWEKLEQAYADSDTVLVASMDCTSDDTKQVCGDHGVKGFPSLQYGDPDAPTTYEGGRDYESLQAFAADLKPPCGPTTRDACSDEDTVVLEELLAMTSADIQAKIDEATKDQAKAEATFERRVKVLQEKYEKFTTTKAETLQEIRQRGVPMWTSVLAFKQASNKDEL